MTTGQIINLLRETEYEGINGASPIFGVRRIPASEKVEIGQHLQPSQQWLDDEPTGDLLSGVCTIGIEIDEESIEAGLESVTAYHNGKILIVGGTYGGTGLDASETIIKDAVVLAIL